MPWEYPLPPETGNSLRVLELNQTTQINTIWAQTESLEFLDLNRVEMTTVLLLDECTIKLDTTVNQTHMH